MSLSFPLLPRRLSRSTLAFALSLVATAVRGQRPATLDFDSATVRHLLDDALGAARAAPSIERSALFAAIGRLQVESRDFGAAERTLALPSSASPNAAAPNEVLRELGQPEWFGMLDRASLARQLVCALREVRRPAEALSVVRRMPASPDAQWLLAHLAVLTMRSATERDSATKLARWHADRADEALAIAREVRLPEARLDALIGIMDATPDTGAGARMLRDVYDEARRIRLADRDRRASRYALLARHAYRARRGEDVPALFDQLSDREDLLVVLAAALGPHGDAAFARRITPIVEDAARTIRDSVARAAYVAQIPGARRDARAQDERDVRAESDSALAHSDYPEDVANRALTRRDFAEVRRQAQRVPLADGGSRRAELWANLAWEEYGASRDTAIVYLGLGRDALEDAAARTQVDSAARDDAAAHIARNYFWLGDADDGMAILDLIRDPALAAGPLREWGGSSFGRASTDSSRAFAQRLRDRRVRDAALARLVEIDLVSARPAWAVALADSIATPGARVTAGLAVSNMLKQHGDTAAARKRLVALLEPQSADGDRSDTIVGILVSLHAWRDAATWANASVASPVERARRLLMLARVLNRAVQSTLRGPYYMIRGNGPDGCLDEF